MKFDDPKLDEAFTRTTEKLDGLLSVGELNNYTLSEVLVLATFKSEDDQEKEFILVEGTTPVPSVQAGILYLALNVVTGG